MFELNLGVENFFERNGGSEKNFVLKNFGSRIFFGLKQIGGAMILLVQKFWAKKFWSGTTTNPNINKKQLLSYHWPD